LTGLSNERRPSRRALGALVLGGCGIGGAGVLVPAARLALGAGGRPVFAPWVRTVRVEALGYGVPKRVPLVADRRDAWTLERAVELGAVWLLHAGAGVKAWSVVCPHLGCAIARRPGSASGSASGDAPGGPGFSCPCHDSVFDAEGRRVSGPSPRDLDELATRIDDVGYVFVEFRRFRPGTREKIAVG
jgi:menaquinol-cytochrome c reductase iron-sulfur subunit